MDETTETTGQLFAAIKAGDAGTVAALLARQPGLIDATDADSMTPLMTAAYGGRREVADLLIDKGAAVDVFAAATLGNTARVEEVARAHPGLVNTYSADGWTPLALAAHFGHGDAAEALLAHGADVHARSRNRMGNLPLHAAAAGSQRDVAALLLARGAAVDARDDRGWTALTLAAGNGSPELVDLLLRHNADARIANDAGETALALAERDGHEAIVAALRRAMA